MRAVSLWRRCPSPSSPTCSRGLDSQLTEITKLHDVRGLGLPEGLAEAFIADLKRRMTAGLDRLTAVLADGSAGGVRVTTRHGSRRRSGGRGCLGGGVRQIQGPGAVAEAKIAICARPAPRTAT